MTIEMVAKDLLEWKLLTAILDAHPEESLHDANSPAWTSRDVYAHLARWMNYSNKDIEAYCAGRDISAPVSNAEELNLRWQKEDSGMTVTEARKRAQEAFDQRMRLIRSITSDRWDKKLERIARYDGAEHFAVHRSYIKVTQ